MARAESPRPNNYRDHEEVVTAQEAQTHEERTSLLVANHSRDTLVSVRDSGQGRGNEGCKEYVYSG